MTDTYFSSVQTPEEPRQVLRLVPGRPSYHVYQRRQSHCPAWTKPLARCMEACHHAQAQQIIPNQEDLDVLPQIFVHQTRAQTKSNLIHKTINKNSEHCGAHSPKCPRVDVTNREILPTREPEQGTPQENNTPAGRYMFSKNTNRSCVAVTHKTKCKSFQGFADTTTEHQLRGIVERLAIRRPQRLCDHTPNCRSVEKRDCCRSHTRNMASK